MPHMSPFQRVYFSLTSDPNSFSWRTAPPFFLYLITERDPSASNPCWGGVPSFSAPMVLVFTRKRVYESVFLTGSSPLGPKNKKIWREVVSAHPASHLPAHECFGGRLRTRGEQGKEMPSFTVAAASPLSVPQHQITASAPRAESDKLVR